MSHQLNYNLASFYCKRRANNIWRSFAEFDAVNPLPASILTDLGIMNDLIDTMKKINELHQDKYQRMRRDVNEFKTAFEKFQVCMSFS